MRAIRLASASLGRPISILGSVLALLVTAACAADSQKAAQLLSCFSSDCAQHRTTWAHFLGDRPGCLAAANVWWSNEAGAALPITLVTQLSADRLSQLGAQCKTWAGPLAAALYVAIYSPTPELGPPALKKLAAAEKRVNELFETSEARARHGGCQLRMVLMYEVFAEEKAAVLYPVNSLRNYARLLADTDLITNIDVDMVPSTSISAALSSPAALQRYAQAAAQNHVFVWPAFETRCGGRAYADKVAASRKDELPALMREDCVGQMRGKVAPACHNSTLYDKWFASTEPYGVTYTELFEPWFLSARRGAEWFDYRYRGYGKNKIVQAAAMNASRFTFNVFPAGFLVHRPHPESKARKIFIKEKFSRKDFLQLQGTVYEHIESLWNGTRRALAAGTYRVAVEDSFLECLRSLPWWAGT